MERKSYEHDPKSKELPPITKDQEYMRIDVGSR